MSKLTTLITFFGALLLLSIVFSQMSFQLPVHPIKHLLYTSSGGGGGGSGGSGALINFNSADLVNALQSLESIFPGTSNVNPVMFWLTFALIAVVVYALLSLVKPLNDDKYKGIRVIIAIIIAIFAATIGIESVILQRLSGAFGLAVIFLIMVLVIYALMSQNTNSTAAKGIAVIIFILIGIGIILYSGLLESISLSGLGSIAQRPIISGGTALLLIVFGIVLIAMGGKTTKIVGVVLIIAAIALAMI